jgi:uncharacterized protein YkwD
MGAWSGWRKGFLFASADLISWAGSLLLGFYTYQYVAAFMDDHVVSLGPWTFPISFLFVVMIARWLVSLLLSRVFQLTSDSVHASVTNHTFGILPGAIKGLIYATILAALLLAMPVSNALTQKTRDSRLANALSSQVEWLDEQLSPIFDRTVNKTMNKLVVEPEAEETIKLKFTVHNAEARADLEVKMLDLVNEERKKARLSPLVADEQLRQLARAHSNDMLARGYFSHITPDGQDPFDRMRKAGIHFNTAGENLAFAATLAIAHRGLMESPGHRANILRPSFGKIGIGILDGGRYGLMISQEFKN